MNRPIRPILLTLSLAAAAGLATAQSAKRTGPFLDAVSTKQWKLATQRFAAGELAELDRWRLNYLFALAASKSGDSHDALRTLNHVIAKRPDDARAHYLRAALHAAEAARATGERHKTATRLAWGSLAAVIKAGAPRLRRAPSQALLWAGDAVRIASGKRLVLPVPRLRPLNRRDSLDELEAQLSQLDALVKSATPEQKQRAKSLVKSEKFRELERKLTEFKAMTRALEAMSDLRDAVRDQDLPKVDRTMQTVWATVDELRTLGPKAVEQADRIQREAQELERKALKK